MRIQKTSNASLQERKRPGIGIIVIVIVLVIIIVVGGATAYYVVFVSSTTSTNQTSTQGSNSSSSQQSTSTSTIISSTTLTIVSTTSTPGQKTYSGTFNYTNPEGPGGERVFSNNTVQTYGSVQLVSGSFTFSINPQNYLGTGSGHGTLTVTTTGFCSGNVTVPYVFSIQATQPPGENITIGFSTPNPVNATVPLTCTGPMNGVNTATNNPVPFLSEYPGLVTFAVAPFTESQNLGAGISYYVTISPAN